MTPFPILYEDNHLLVVVKPAGIATMGLPAGEETLLTQAQSYIKDRYQKPGKVYLGVVSRLDVPVSGVIVFARTSKAAERLNAQFRTRQVEKEYIALVSGNLVSGNHAAENVIAKKDECVDWLLHDERHRSVRIVSAETRGAQEARLKYEVLERHKNFSLLRIQLLTGRKHQIRVQLAQRGFPICGDRKYGSTYIFPRGTLPQNINGITLHAASLTITHPVREEILTFTAPIPDFWQKISRFHGFNVTNQNG